MKSYFKNNAAKIQFTHLNSNQQKDETLFLSIGIILYSLLSVPLVLSILLGLAKLQDMKIASLHCHHFHSQTMNFLRQNYRLRLNFCIVEEFFTKQGLTIKNVTLRQR